MEVAQKMYKLIEFLALVFKNNSVILFKAPFLEDMICFLFSKVRRACNPSSPKGRIKLFRTSLPCFSLICSNKLFIVFIAIHFFFFV